MDALGGPRCTATGPRHSFTRPELPRHRDKGLSPAWRRRSFQVGQFTASAQSRLRLGARAITRAMERAQLPPSADDE